MLDVDAVSLGLGCFIAWHPQIPSSRLFVCGGFLHSKYLKLKRDQGEGEDQREMGRSRGTGPHDLWVTSEPCPGSFFF